jgi:hypothetical protein
MPELEGNLMKGAILGVSVVAVQLIAGGWLAMIPGGPQVLTIATVAVGFTLAKMVKVI